MSKMKFPLFSRSPLWQLQRDYFETQGIKAWQQGEVPQYVTSNPAVAKAYAETVFGFFRDRARLFPGNKEKIYLLELGAGSGRFAFHFLNYFSSRCEQAAFEVPAWRYVLSDFAGPNITYWQQHSRLQPFVQKGLLDFARFDAENDAELQLVHSGEKITAGSLSQPLIVIANYFFDGITQDLFFLKGQKLHDVHVELEFPELPVDASPAQKLEKLEISYRPQVVAGEYYPDRGLNDVLETYRSGPGESWFLFPHTGLRCLERLKALSREGFLLLSCDKGNHRAEDVQSPSPPFIAKHGSFSLPVNYHAIRNFYEQQQAVALFTQHRHHSINAGTILALPGAAEHRETMQAYDHFVGQYGPDDFFVVKSHSLRSLVVMSLPAILAHLRLGGYDADIFLQCIPRLLSLLETTNDAAKSDMLPVIRNVWNNYFPIGEKHDLAFDAGMLLYAMDLYPEALEFFTHSLDHYEAAAPVYYNMAACYFQLKEDAKAMDYVNKTLALEPAHEGALGIRSQLETIASIHASS